MKRHVFLRGFYGVLGWCALGIGLVGLALPVMPGTVFLIIALFCFAKSNERWEKWLLEHPRLGPVLRKWRESLAIPRNIKVLAITAVGFSTLATLFLLPQGLPLRIAVGMGGAFICLYLLTLPVSPPSEASNKNIQGSE
jgi:uncharacterized membrane protein YbaN (DUF454 family)